MENNPTLLKETLERLLMENDTIFIVAHDNPDFDALGAEIGMSLICEKFKKRVFIVIDDDINSIESGTEKIVEDIKNRFPIIKASEIQNLKGNKNLLIVLDVNKEYLVSVKPYFKIFEDIIIIDHHNSDEKTIKNSYKFIYPEISSTSEIMANLMSQFCVKYNPKDYASYLLAGIMLDTNNFTKNTSAKTHEAALKLIKNGANSAMANNLFLEDFKKDRVVQRLVEETNFFEFNLAITCDSKNSDVIYAKEDLAKAADYLLKYNVNASFVIGKINEDTFYISARSKGIIDVGQIMSAFPSGGGNMHSAAAKVPASISIEELKSILTNTLTPGYFANEENKSSMSLKLVR